MSVSPPQSPAFRLPQWTISRRQSVTAAGAACAVLSVAVQFWNERLCVLGVLVVALCLAGATVAGSPAVRRWVCLPLALNLTLVLLYLWSLGDTVHVVVRVTPTQYIASVDGALSAIPRHAATGKFGFFSADQTGYRVQPDGEAQVRPPTDPAGRFGEWMRYAALRPAWTNIFVTVPGRTPRHLLPAQFVTAEGAWSTNRRGELEGNFNSTAISPLVLPRSYTVSADLMRGDGTQGMLFDIDSHFHASLLAVRLDQPDALWFRWTAGNTYNALGGTPLVLPALPMAQRDLRLILGNAVTALLLLPLALLLYGCCALLLRLLGEPDGDDLGVLPRLFTARTLDALAAVAAAVALVVTALIATYWLQRIPHVQDSVAYLFQAQTYALGRLSVPAPTPTRFFTEEFIPMYHGQWFGKYPPGWPLLLAVGVLLHAPWLVDPVLTGLNLGLIYLIGRELYGHTVALPAALLALSSPFFLFLGASFMAHSACLFYLQLFAYLMIRWKAKLDRGGSEPRDAWKLALPAGFALGMAAATRQLDALAFAVPFLLLVLRPPMARRIWESRWIVCGAALPLLGLGVYNWRLMGSPTTSPYTLWWSFDTVGFGPYVGMGGFTPGQGLWNTGLNLQMLLAHLYGWPFYVTLALLLLPFLLARASRWDLFLLLGVAAPVLAYALYWAPGVMYGPRYYYVAIPWLALLTARGLEELYRLPLRIPFFRPADAAAAFIVPALFVALLITYNVGVYLPAQRDVYTGYNYVNDRSLQAVARAHLHHALVFVVTDPPFTWWSYGSVFSANSPLLNGDVVYARDFGAADRLLAGRYPGRSYYRLRGASLARATF